jgi:hypothetical protein
MAGAQQEESAGHHEAAKEHGDLANSLSQHDEVADLPGPQVRVSDTDQAVPVKNSVSLSRRNLARRVHR